MKMNLKHGWIKSFWFLFSIRLQMTKTNEIITHIKNVENNYCSFNGKYAGVHPLFKQLSLVLLYAKHVLYD